MDKESIFTKKSLDKATELDQLNSYLKMTGVSAWMMLAAAVMTIVCIFLWGSIARIDDQIRGAGECKDGMLTCYFRLEDVDYIKKGAQVEVDGALYEAEEIVPEMVYIDDLPRKILYLSDQAEWYQTVLVPCDLENGTYKVNVVLGRKTPLEVVNERQ